MHFLIQKTCPFDSIIQLLFNGVLENESFREYANGSENSSFKLALNLMKNGVKKNPKIYNERFSILHKFYQEIEPRQKMQWTSDEEKSKALVISRVIDCKDNVTRLWNNLFQDEPSLFENFLCESQQCNFRLSKPAIGVDYHVLLKNGIQDLQSALIFRSSFKKLCPVCKSIQTCEQKLNMYIYIELDIRLRNDIKGLSCKLRNFPIILNIKESQTKVIRYR